MAVTLLTGKALTWWQSVANENWARLGICTAGKIFAMRLKLNSGISTMPCDTSLACLTCGSGRLWLKYNEEFRAIMLEVET